MLPIRMFERGAYLFDRGKIRSLNSRTFDRLLEGVCGPRVCLCRTNCLHFNLFIAPPFYNFGYMALARSRLAREKREKIVYEKCSRV